MHDIYAVGLVSLISLIVASFSYHPILKLARKLNIYDNPEARKLQRTPIPVMGGFVVLFGVIAGSVCYWFVHDSTSILPLQIAMLVMLIVGAWDDLKDLSPYTIFMVEIIVVLLLAYATDSPLNNFRGLWGIHEVSPWIAWPLTVVACVGIINAINMVDGIDGLSSGLCIMAIVGSLVPFFIMNVFGRKSKMYIGDAGTMMLGIAICDFVMAILANDSLSAARFEESGFCFIAFLLAVLAIPVFDTLRVMIRRIMHRQSPFRPDKSHLHHAFIDYGFHHLETSLLEIILNMLIILFWGTLEFSHLPMQWQLYGVVAASMTVSVGLYRLLVKYKQKGKDGE